jgi:hypothetical protein
MIKGLAIIGVLNWILLTEPVFSQAAEKAKEPRPAEDTAATAVGKTEKKTEPSLIGEWNLKPGEYRTRGSITFREDGTYSKTEWDPEGVGATISGEYKIDRSREPFAIDLCLEKCDGPGSEWTTHYGIFKFRDDGTVVIQLSPDAKRPTAFADEPNLYTLILTRAEKKE